MKNLLLVILTCLCLSGAYAQKIVEKHFDFAQKNFVALNIQIADSIRIITWNKNEVYVKASININDNKDNDDYAVSFDDSGARIEMKAKFVEKPQRVKNDSCHCYCNNTSKIYCDVYLPENAAFSVETIDGNITISGKTDEMKVHTISGFIDLTMAPDRKADVKLNTISGTIYSNLALNGAEHKAASSTISQAYNGGGKPLNLETISGDIFIRKAE